MKDEKEGLFKRVGSGGRKYLSRRFGNEFINKVGRDNVTGSYAAAKDALKIEPISRQELRGGIYGRYADGGRERFSQMMHQNGLKEDDLTRMAFHRRRDALITFSAAIGFLLFGAWSIFSSSKEYVFIYSSSTLIVSLVLFAVGLRHDFSRWQIESRRFGGFREYFTGRSSSRAGEKPGRSVEKR
ncbi:hypothetical protein [Pseudosulfitobacter pseudonitzschiae]|uniref:hypothetical protein n=1 Tax=Pseudosulfitobacter pseudonitzschiae TaxID=1402135 RepID=UPI003B780DA7